MSNVKVCELIAVLEDLDPEAIVVLQKDSEGNGYSPLHGAEGGLVYIRETDWRGDTKYVTLTEKQMNSGYGPGDVYSVNEDGDDFPRCVVLFPVN